IKASNAFLRTVSQAVEEALLEFRPLPQSPQGPYLPGSSVKGALRTAWLFHTLVERGEEVVFQEGRWQFRKARGEPKVIPPKFKPKPREELLINQHFEATVLGYLKPGKGGRPEPNLYADPFRAVRLTDSNPGEGFLNRIGIFHPKGTMKGTVLLAETFRMGSKFHFLFRYQPGLAQHQGVAQPIPPAKLVRALREYYSHVAEWERAFAEEHQLVKALEVYHRLEERLNDPNVFPIRLGFGSGRLAIRLALLLPEDHPEGQEPKTRKTAGAENPQDGYPLGWAVGRLVPLG
ncbi:type III-A CRISPR-associated RAMP protein Csm5, partial [Thermus altitudinis]|uniref:type III-A CRISPR-associated RAMP protein Csm5 n=1 Tax=Thermus altitudinis TaxID=2908145 RepID=UPI001FAA9BD2